MCIFACVQDKSSSTIPNREQETFVMFNKKINKMARKITKKLNKSQKSLLLGLLIGDGTITNHPDFKIDHSKAQIEYLEWKAKLLDDENIKHSNIKEYIQKAGYNKGGYVVRLRISTTPTIKAIRRSLYKPNKTITLNLLNWFSEREIAIWYLDDGCINVNTSSQRSSIQHTIRIATCTDIKTTETIIKYFKDRWNVNFRMFPEGNNTFSIASRTENDCLTFVNIVKPYIEQVPSMLYKIRDNFTKEDFIAYQKTDSFQSARHIIGE